jgi:hypothetical protein
MIVRIVLSIGLVWGAFQIGAAWAADAPGCTYTVDSAGKKSGSTKHANEGETVDANHQRFICTNGKLVKIS